MPGIKFNCEYCQQPLEAPSEMAQETIECPACKHTITIPSERVQKYNDSGQQRPASQPRPRAKPNVSDNSTHLDSQSSENTTSKARPLYIIPVFCLFVIILFAALNLRKPAVTQTEFQGLRQARQELEEDLLAMPYSRPPNLSPRAFNTLNTLIVRSEIAKETRTLIMSQYFACIEIEKSTVFIYETYGNNLPNSAGDLLKSFAGSYIETVSELNDKILLNLSKMKTSLEN